MIFRAAVSVCAVVLIAAVASANMAPPNDFYLGISVVSSIDGPKVSAVKPMSPAAKAGVQVGDIILGADKRWTKAMSADEVKAYIDGPHWFSELIVVRGGQSIETIQVRR